MTIVKRTKGVRFTPLNVITVKAVIHIPNTSYIFLSPLITSHWRKAHQWGLQFFLPEKSFVC